MSTNITTHPAPRALHTLRNVLLILTATRELNGSIDVDEQLAHVAATLEPVLEDVAALHQDNEAKDVRIADLLETGMANALYIQRLEDKNTGLNEQLIAVTARLAAHEREVELFHAELSETFGGLAQLVRQSKALRESATLNYTESPRIAAAGSR